MEFCFGKSGLIAISIAQWAFAFGGMVAFGIIVGDTIPHVFVAVWPGIREVPVLGLLGDRRAVIVIFVLGVSYPLSLYRDIAKVCAIDVVLNGWGVVLTDGIVGQSEYFSFDQYAGHSIHSSYTRILRALGIKRDIRFLVALS